MKRTIKAFAEFPALIDNTVDTVATLGEMSIYSRTFATEMTTYSASGVSAELVHVMSCKDDKGARVAVSPTQQKELLDVARYVQEGIVSNAFTVVKAEFLRLFTGKFGALADHFVLGNMAKVTVGSAVHVGPEWVRWYGGGDGLDITLYFNDIAFQDNFGEYEYKLVPPLKNTDDLFDVYGVVKPLLDAVKPGDAIKEVNALAGHQRYSKLIHLNYQWKDPTNPLGAGFMTEWYVILYGQAGDDPELLRRFLAARILSTKTHTKKQWLQVLPTIFAPVEYTIVPLWDHYSIPDKMLQPGLWSPSVDFQKILPNIRKLFPYPKTHVDTVTRLTASLYRSLLWCSAGHVGNNNKIFNIAELHKDYLLVPTSSPDFNRMLPATQNFIAMLFVLFGIAEHYGEPKAPPLPSGFTVITKKSVDYITVNQDGIVYQVVTKASYMAQITWA